MRIVSNERHIRVHRGLTTGFSLSGVALLVGSIIFPIVRNSLTPPLWLVLIAVVISSIGLRLSHYWLRQPTPHEALQQGLKGMSKDYTLYHFRLPAPHVLIGPQGVFSLTVLPQAISLIANGDAVYRGERIGRQLLGAIGRQDTVGNPLRRSYRQAHKLQTWLDKNIPGHEVQVQPLLVLTSPEAKLEAHDPLLPVMYADKRKPSLKATIRGLPKSTAFTAAQLQDLQATLE